MKSTLLQAKNEYQWSQFTNLCSTSLALAGYLNEAVMRLRPKGLWVGITQRYQVCTCNACFTWPRQVETIEAAWICKTPATLRNDLFEALPNSYGLLDSESSIGSALIDVTGQFCTHTDLLSARKIALFSSQPLDAGKAVLLQGRDSGANWVLTNSGATDGESLTLVNGYKVSTTVWSPPGLTGVQKAKTLGPVRAYSVLDTCPSGVVADISTFDPIAIAYWEPDETLPCYRRSLVPQLQNAGACDDSQTDCENTQVTVLAKLQFIKATKDTDYLQIGNLPALKEEVQSILKGERGLIAESEAHEARAVRLLEEELMSYIGHGVVQPFKVEDCALFGVGCVENPVNG